MSRETGQPAHSVTWRKEARTCPCGKEFEVHIRTLDGKDDYGSLTDCPTCREKAQEEKILKDVLGDLPRVQAEQKEKWEEQCNLPTLFIGKTFANFDRKLQPKAFDVMKKYDGESIVLLSPDLYGVGKTHLLAALINNLIETGETAKVTRDGYSIRKYRCPVYFTAENTLLSRIRQTFNRSNQRNDDEFYEETEEDVYHGLEKFALLVIDDVGKVRPRDYSFLQSVYFRIIDSRYSNEMPIILTTNLGFTELENHIGGAGSDRLREMCGENFVKMTGKSYRQRESQKPPVNTAL